MANEKWILIRDIPPVVNEVVNTKVHDHEGERNLQKLKWDGKLWWHPDGSMYVYYTPTHWQSIR